MLCGYGIVASYLFGLLTNLWFWPFAVGAGTGTAEAVIGVLTLVTSIALGLLVGSALALPLNRITRRLQHVVRR